MRHTRVIVDHYRGVDALRVMDEERARVPRATHSLSVEGFNQDASTIIQGVQIHAATEQIMTCFAPRSKTAITMI
jgi:hypothetical protein